MPIFTQNPVVRWVFLFCFVLLVILYSRGVFFLVTRYCLKTNVQWEWSLFTTAPHRQCGQGQRSSCQQEQLVHHISSCCLASAQRSTFRIWVYVGICWWKGRGWLGKGEEDGAGGERWLIDWFFIERMTVLGRGLILQPVLISLPHTQTSTYNSDTIITLQNILALQIFHQN